MTLEPGADIAPEQAADIIGIRIEGALDQALPAPVSVLRADHVDGVPLACRDEQIGAHVGGVGQVLGRREALGGQRRVDRHGPHGLVHAGAGGVGVHDRKRGLGTLFLTG